MATLFVVATPIGNLEDGTARMRRVLEEVALIAAEDTRVTGNLLRHFGFRRPMTSLHRHNEAGKAEPLIARMLQEDIDVALVTDAGTPAISDPGYLLVEAAANAGVNVVPIPGPSAVVAALSICGFDTRSFAFYGFLPREKKDLMKRLQTLPEKAPVAVLYESPHRVVDLMDAVAETLPACRACVCCDLTKLYEKTVRGSADMVARLLRENPKVEKGEYCVVLDLHEAEREPAEKIPTVSLEAQLFDGLLNGLSMKEAIEAVVEGGARRNEAKRASLAVKAFLDRD